ncbi:dihydrofolate reductase family protein [Aldersonia kunmingensis]|uniref:dihydrofolate reductase family protein n=1 Tax=Aldersonia kunmingensis TaxID=408066 RepID=UPI00082DE9AF|nr:dihydrofolate reductase family protein [Aldersonia kunmingensis]
MARVIFSMGMSVDGFIATPDGDISWSAPDPDLFRFHIELNRSVTGHLLGRRLYETMLVWETDELSTGEDEEEWARIWRAIPKVVFSRTLDSVEGNARLATDDVATEIARLRDEPGAEDVGIGGAELAAAAIAEDLIDEYHLFVNPVILGSGTRYFPPVAQKHELRLTETRTFDSRIVFLRYERAR